MVRLSKTKAKKRNLSGSKQVKDPRFTGQVSPESGEGKQVRKGRASLLEPQIGQ
jgi:hypothetical protein